LLIVYNIHILYSKQMLYCKIFRKLTIISYYFIFEKEKKTHWKTIHWNILAGLVGFFPGRTNLDHFDSHNTHCLCRGRHFDLFLCAFGFAQFVVM